MALIDGVKRMSHLLQGNVEQYRGLVAKLQDPAVSRAFLDLRDPNAHDDLLNEAERLLHNVLTAMSTRVDQQRHFMAKHFADDPALTKEYLERIDRDFIASAEAAFLKGLRNYIAHSRQTFTNTSFRITFILPAAPLLEWDGWNADIKTWITGQGDDIPIVDVVDAYARLADDFDRWLVDQIRLKYRADIDTHLRERSHMPCP
jgi:hypothetical protein